MSNAQLLLSTGSTVVTDIALADGKIIIGDASGIAAAVPMSGDATIANTGVITVTGASGAFAVTGVLTISDGTAAAPGLAFAGSSSNTGIFLVATDSIGISTMGAQRMNIDASGRVGVNTTAGTNVFFYITGASPTTSTSQFGMLCNPTFSGATSNLFVIETQVATANVSETVGSARAFYATTASKGASSTITRLVNYGGIAQTAGTNNAFLTDNSTFVGNYFLHQTGTTASVFGGAVTVGSLVISSGGVFTLADGTAAAPSLAFSGSSSNTGIFLATTDSIGIATDGTQRMVFDASGRMGFGTGATSDVLCNIGGSGLTTGVNQWGLNMTPSFSGATSSIRVIEAQVVTANVSETVAVGRAFFATTASKGAASTITRLVNYGGVNQTAGGTGNAFMADNATYSGNFFIHQTGTAASSFAGVPNFTAGLQTKVSTANTANPPTNAELVTAFGAAATTGVGFLALVDDNNGHANEYLIWSDGTKYWILTGTAAA